jgi:tetratricopeptide (TPR) repeat protein
VKILLALIPLFATPATQETETRLREVDPLSSTQMVFDSRTSDGVRFWTVKAHQVPVDRFLFNLGTRSGMEIEGLSSLGVNALVTVDLQDRPLDHVLEFALGSVGLNYQLRRDTIEILSNKDGALPASDAITHASLAWLTAINRFPDHPSAPIARLAQGEIAELRGDLTTAQALYLAIPSDYPESLSSTEATMRGGRVLVRLKRWSEASTQFRSLTRDTNALEYHSSARLEIARADVHLGKPQSALYILESLDHDYPTTEPLERTGRALVRAMALNSMDRFIEAMNELDSIGLDLDPLGGSEAFLVRAASLEGLKMNGQAGQAWVQYSREVEGQERVRGLREATRLALLAGDEMGALFVCREAEQIGLGEPLEDLRQEARRRLGLEEQTAPDEVAPVDRLTLAEGWIDQGAIDRAAPVLESIYLGRGALSPEAAVRVTIGWARCIETRLGLASAVRILAEARTGAPSMELKARLDVAAADLFEKHDRYDDAIQAYRGNY